VVLRIDDHSGGGRAREKRRLLLFAGGLVSVVLLWTFLIFFLGVGSGAGESESAGARVDEGSGNGRIGERGREESRLAQRAPAAAMAGSTDEPAGHDPLGIQKQDVPLTPADKGRVKGAAARFVAAAYGYSGRDRDEYLDALNSLLIPQKFYASPGSEEIERLSEQVETTGTKGAAKMSAFEIEEVNRQRAEGYAYFETADSYDRYGELVGNEKGYRQRLTLARSGAIFLVEAAGEVQEVRG
jgi:hypothetical protein